MSAPDIEPYRSAAWIAAHVLPGLEGQVKDPAGWVRRHVPGHRLSQRLTLYLASEVRAWQQEHSPSTQKAA